MAELDLVYNCVANHAEDGKCDRWFFGNLMGATSSGDADYGPNLFYLRVTPKKELYLHQVTFPIKGEFADCQPTKVGTAGQDSNGQYFPYDSLTDMTKTDITFADGSITITIPEEYGPKFTSVAEATRVAVGLPDACMPSLKELSKTTAVAVLYGSDLTPLPTTTPPTHDDVSTEDDVTDNDVTTRGGDDSATGVRSIALLGCLLGVLL